MGEQLLPDEPGAVSHQKSTPSPAQELLRRLALQVANAPPVPVAGATDGKGQEVILEVEVAGARYFLLRSWPVSPPGHVVLSEREEQIARMVAQGYANKTIAAILGISQWTVCTYIRRIFTKIGVGSRAAMVARLLERRSIQEK